MIGMIAYRIRDLAERYRAWRKDRRCSAQVDAILTAHGFVEVSPGEWVRP